MASKTGIRFVTMLDDIGLRSYNILLLSVSCLWPLSSLGIDIKELGVQMSKCLKFCPGIEII